MVMNIMRASTVKARFRMQSSSTGVYQNEQINPNNVPTKLKVNQEYLQALRTKSYTDIWTKVHGSKVPDHEEEEEDNEQQMGTSTTINISPLNTLLEPPQETLMAVGHDSHLHALLLDYFEHSVEAFHICTALLHNINQTRSNYRIIQRILKRVRRDHHHVPGSGADRHYTDEQCRVISGDLAAFARLDNPLSGSSLVQFGQLHDLYTSLLDQLTMTRRKVHKKAKIIKLAKKASGVSLLIVFGAINIGFVVVAAHTIVGLAYVPFFVCHSTTAAALFFKRRRGVLKEGVLAKVGAQLDAAAKGAYILDRDLETMSRLVRRLHDEIEHSKAMINICLRSPKGYLLREVVKEFESGECVFLDQLEELEEHVYLCFLTINRARRLVVQQLGFEQRNTINELDGTKIN